MQRYKSLSGLLFFLFFPALLAAATPADAVSAKSFFLRYIALCDRFDPGLGALFADTAVIRSLRKYPDGSLRLMKMDGKELKALLPKILPRAKARGNRSTYHNVHITVKGDTAVIRAERYSVLEAYWDRDYRMVVRRMDSGDYRIIEEFTHAVDTGGEAVKMLSI